MGVFGSANAPFGEESCDVPPGLLSCGVESQSACEEKERVVKRRQRERRNILKMLMRCWTRIFHQRGSYVIRGRFSLSTNIARRLLGEQYAPA